VGSGDRVVAERSGSASCRAGAGPSVTDPAEHHTAALVQCTHRVAAGHGRTVRSTTTWPAGDPRPAESAGRGTSQIRLDDGTGRTRLSIPAPSSEETLVNDGTRSTTELHDHTVPSTSSRRGDKKPTHRQTSRTRI